MSETSATLPGRIEAMIEIGQDRLTLGWLLILADAVSAIRSASALTDAIRALHVCEQDIVSRCRHCGYNWPCPTIEEIEATR